MHDYHGSLRLTASAHSFSKAYDCYLSLRRNLRKKLDWVLGRDGPDARLLRSCPACFYLLHDEPTLEFSFLCAADGNFSLRRFKKVGTADGSKFESTYFISHSDVDRFANIAQARQKGNKRTATDLSGAQDEQDATLETSNNLAPQNIDSEGGLNPQTNDVLEETFKGLPSECAEKWKANADDRKKVMWDCFDECGVFVVVCRHGEILLACDIVQSGEL